VGVRVVSEPEVVEYPAYGGDGVIRVPVSTITDPDGFIIELNQLLGGLR
ncbi:MAG: VOC family protein, partial [Gammaproteobacteria bacterium]|nr:VOC family protein [Gammaproteobacteria bacterium]